MQFCIENLDQAGGCTYNYSCAYTDSISWASPNEPLPMIRDPRVAFDMLFGSGGTADVRAVPSRDAAQHPRLDPGRCGQRPRPARRGRPHAARPLPLERRRGRAAHQDGRSAEHERRRPGTARRASGRARLVLRAHEAAVRPAGARAADRHDPRHLVQDRTRRAEPRVPGERLEPAVPPGVASRQQRSARSWSSTRSASTASARWPTSSRR